MHNRKPERLTNDELQAFSSIDALVEATTGKSYESEFSWRRYASAVQGYVHARDYCAANGGELIQMKRLPAPTAGSRSPTPTRIDRDARRRFLSDTTNAFGQFECVVEGTSVWGIAIAHSNLLEDRDRASTKARATISIGTQSAELLAFEKQEKEEAAKAQLARYADLKRKRALRQSANEKLLSELSLPALASDQNVGRKICRPGTLRYRYDTGIVVLGKQQYRDISELGILSAFLDGFSQDRTRIRFRILGASPISGAFQRNPSTDPVIDEFTVSPGAVFWDVPNRWYLCP